MHNVTAIRIGPDRERLNFVAGKGALFLAEVRVQCRLVSRHAGIAELANIGTTAASNATRPGQRLGVEVDFVAFGIRDHARLALGSKNGVIRLLLRHVQIGLDAGDLFIEQCVGAALLFDFGQPGVISRLELLEPGVKRVYGFSCLLDLV